MKWDDNEPTFKVEGLTEGVNDGDVGVVCSFGVGKWGVGEI